LTVLFAASTLLSYREVGRDTAQDDVEELIKQFDLAAGELLKGNPEPVKKWFSHRQDVTLGTPLGPFRTWMGAGRCRY
jgi:hypothetical protein